MVLFNHLESAVPHVVQYVPGDVSQTNGLRGRGGNAFITHILS